MNRLATVLVGTDGSVPAQRAVRWAAVEAERRDARLTILHAYDESWIALPGWSGEDYVDAARNRAEAILADARVAAHTVVPGIPVQTEAVPGHAAEALLDSAASAALVVVGNRGHTNVLLGSVSHRVASHAPCPTVVVRGRSMMFEGPVTVGVDDSPGGRVALEVAFAAADVRRAPLLAVRAYRLPATAATPGMPIVMPADVDRVAQSEADAVSQLVTPWREKFPAVRVQTLIARNNPAPLLVEVSHQAQLVVVGSRGFGAVAGTLVGSVSLQLLHHAHCPVLVARG